METLSKVFNYNGSKITFNKNGVVMINATEMAKPFGKLAKDWLSNKSTKEFLASLSAVRRIPLTGLVIIKQGGNSDQGTWMHEDVALEFARWLSPAFAIWCNDRIKELLTTGVSTVRNDDEAIAYAMEVLNKRLQKSKAQNELLEQQNNNLNNELQKQAPKVAYVDNVLQSVNTYNTNLIAKEMGMSAETLNKKLQDIGVQYRQGGVWVLTHKYQNKGYTKTRTHTFTRSDGTTGTSMLTVWTEKGREFLHKIMKSDTNMTTAAAM